MTQMPNAIDIAICTFQREHITRTLQSLDKLTGLDGCALQIIVADNDDTPSAKDRVEKTAAGMKIPVKYVHAPSRNISIARNACLDAASAPLLAIIDDDEWVDPNWLSELISALQAEDADIALGPVTAHYAKDAQDWIKNGDFHATRPVWIRGQIITAYTCNVLFKRTAAPFNNLRFNLAYGKSGGEDTAYFYAAHRAGAKIAYAPSAMVHEDIPHERASLSWLIKRRFRAGQTHAAIILHADAIGLAERMKRTAIATIKLGISSGMTMLTCIHPVQRRFWLLRGVMQLGIILRLYGKQEIEQYG